MTDAELLALQFSLQRIGVDADGCLIRLPGPNPDGVPRALLRHPRGQFDGLFPR